jgi:nicotinamide mononucleotide adenylyltransferase
MRWSNIVAVNRSWSGAGVHHDIISGRALWRAPSPARSTMPDRLCEIMVRPRSDVQHQGWVVRGRFQPFHLDHLKYALESKRRCDFLLVGVTNPDPSLTKPDAADPARSLPKSNPFTYYERMIIARESLLEAGIPREPFDIVPFPINRRGLWDYYVPSAAVVYMTISDEWGRKKRKELIAGGRGRSPVGAAWRRKKR